MSNSYGNIVNTNLADVINNSNFTQVWTLNKDKINVCKDCEFRYVCTDCRAYLDSPLDLYSKPLKCGYDPYTCKWEDWSKNPLRQQAIEHYNIIL
jgi:SPASM domain peptide maturase of grasp-with-spasm system